MKTQDLRHSDKWNGVHRGIHFEIVRWKLGEETAWNYYLSIHERQTPLFSEIWKEPEIYRFSEDSPPRAQTRDDGSILHKIPWHGGITLYQGRNASLPGCREVYAGCDFLHCFDRDIPYTLECVLSECLETCEAAAELLGIEETK